MKRMSAAIRFGTIFLLFFSSISLLNGCLANTSKEIKSESDTVMVMRGGRAVEMPKPKSDLGKQEELKPPVSISSWMSYHKPPRYNAPRADKWHFFGFIVTPDFEAATQAFLSGDGEAALKYYDRVVNEEKKDDTRSWRASYERILTLIMMGRPDLAEAELPKVEAKEQAFLKSNMGTRGLRAEVRFWNGDIEGALSDTEEVIRYFGSWQFNSEFEYLPNQEEFTRIAVNATVQIRAFTVRGMCFLTKGRYKEALPWLELAARGLEEIILLAGNPFYGSYISTYPEIFYGTGLCLTGMGAALIALDPDSQRAKVVLEWAAEYFDAIGYAAGNVTIEAAKAQVLLKTNHYELAAAAAQKGLAKAEKLELLDFIWRLAAVRGEALYKLGNWNEAEKSLRYAQSLVDLISGTMTTDEAKVRFGSGKEIITQYLVEIDVKKKDNETLFQDMERGRARAFVSMLAQHNVGLERNPDIVAGIRKLDNEILKERRKKNAFASTGKSRENMERDLLEKRTDLVNKLRALDPELADVFSVSAVDLASVRKKLLPGEIMAYFLPAEESEFIRILLVSGDRVTLKTLTLSAKKLQMSLEAFDRARTGKTTMMAEERSVTVVTKKTVDREIKSREGTILDELGSKLELDQWGATKAVYVVPSGNAYFIPWGALDMKLPVAVLPTGGWIGRSSFTGRGVLRATVVGDPYFGGQFPQLAGARREAYIVAKEYGVKPLIGREASETALRQSVGTGVDVLHLATHALYDPFTPLQSALILTDGKKPASLTAGRLFEKPIPAHLVIMSACETGMGQVIAGDDILGLTRSFYLGGAGTILGSLWPVDDEATLQFMEIFHAKSKGGDFGGAWLAAMSTLKNNGYPPSAYGAFTLGGSLGDKR